MDRSRMRGSVVRILHPVVRLRYRGAVGDSPREGGSGCRVECLSEVLPLDPDRQRDADRFGRADFYGWSEDKARQVAVNERDDFGAFVRSKRFRLD